jgi:Orn/Lys/Arg decarboxylase, major domain
VQPGRRAARLPGRADLLVSSDEIATHREYLDIATRDYEAFGIPATILASYLRENGIIPEKSDLNSLLNEPLGQTHTQLRDSLQAA